MSDELQRTLEMTDAALWAGIVSPGALPAIATVVLASGGDSPGLRALAGLDLAPFDPDDARELFEQVHQELGISRLADPIGVAAGMLCRALEQGAITIDDALRRLVDIPGAIDYSGDDLEDLYFLEHDWSERDEPWAPSRAALETSIHETAGRLARSVRDVPDVLVHAIASSS